MATAKTLAHYPSIQPFEWEGKDFLRGDEFTRDQLEHLLQLAIYLKQLQKAGQTYQPLKGKTLGMIFDKSSTRTRVSFEVGMYQLGGMGMYLNGKELQIGRGEPISDTAKVLSRYVDGIMIRTHGHEIVEELAANATIPIINGLTDLFHPCQALADLQTMLEHKGKLQGTKLTYIGDGNNVAHSLVLTAAILGVDVRVATPAGYEMNAEITATAQKLAEENGGKVLTTTDAEQAVFGTDFVYTDVWTSMGFEAENEIRLNAFADYQVNAQLMQKASPDYGFLHCLPAHRGEEVTAEVIDGEHSVVFDQAENRLHAQKAIMATLL